MEKEFIPINAIVTNPAHGLFKNYKDRCQCKIILCSNSSNCELYAKNQCSFLRTLGSMSCPYGKNNWETGFTGRARGYSEWIQTRKEKYKDILFKIKDYTDGIFIVGDYVFVSYPHMNLNKDVPFLSQGSIFSSGSYFMKKEDFTVENILKMINFKPYALMGGEITSYQKEVVPKFIKCLKETQPKLFEEVAKQLPTLHQIYEENKSNVGRKAILQTLKPNVGVFTDCHKADWVWDGIYLTSINSHASFMLINKFTEIKIKPADNVEVTITSDEQVTAETKFTN